MNDQIFAQYSRITFGIVVLRSKNVLECKRQEMFFFKTFFWQLHNFLKKINTLINNSKKNYLDIIDIMFYFVQTIVEAFNQLRLCVVGLLLFVCLFGLFLKRFFFGGGRSCYVFKRL